MKVVIDKSAVREYLYGNQNPTVTIGKSAIVFNSKAVKKHELKKGTHFCFEFIEGILFLKLTAPLDESFEITTNLGRGGNLRCIGAKGLLEVVKKHCGYTSVKKLLYKIGDLKDGMYKLSYIPENAKSQDAASIQGAK